MRQILAWRNNTGMIPLKRGDKTYMIRNGVKGAPDIIGCLDNGRFLALEVKRPGKGPSPDQEVFLKKLADRGALVAVVHDIGEVASLLL